MGDLNKFIIYLKRQGQAPGTIDNNVFLIKKILYKLNPLSKELLDEMIYEMIENHNAKSYIEQHVTVVRHWGKCFDLEIKDYIAPQKIKVDREEFIKGTFADDEIDRFLELPYWGKGNGLYKQRYGMMTLFFSIWAYSGMRGGEISKLTVDDVDFGRNVFIVRKGKLGAGRTVAISPFILPLLHEHIETLAGRYLFPALHRTGCPHIKDDAWSEHFNKRIAKIGIKRKNLTGYSFRHSFITRNVEEQKNSLPHIQAQVGHRKLDTTAKYIHLSEKAKREVVLNDRLLKRGSTIEEALDDYYKLQHELAQKFFNFFKVNINWNIDGGLDIKALPKKVLT